MNTKKIIIPTERQQEWADCEIGMIIHLDLTSFDTHYYENHPPYDRSGLALFDPDALDTDQWVETAVKAGAKYVLLTAKHGTGFTLFPSSANDFSIADTPYQNGRGDVVGSFIESCKKYGVRPGFYYNTGYNWYYGFAGGLPKDGDHTKIEAYNHIVLQQLEELWGRYGEEKFLKFGLMEDVSHLRKAVRILFPCFKNINRTQLLIKVRQLFPTAFDGLVTKMQ